MISLWQMEPLRAPHSKPRLMAQPTPRNFKTLKFTPSRIWLPLSNRLLKLMETIRIRRISALLNSNHRTKKITGQSKIKHRLKRDYWQLIKDHYH